MEPVFITEDRKLELEAELLERKTITRLEISERVATARAHGDLSENAEYHSARESQGKNEGRIQEIEYILKHGKIVQRSGSDVAELGASVTLKKSGVDDHIVYKLVGPHEADMAQGRLSVESPLGSCILGKRAGESCSVETPRGSVEYNIIEIT